MVWNSSQKLHLVCLSLSVLKVSQIETCRERNEGVKLRSGRLDFPIPATTANETGANSFAWLRWACMWSQIVEWSTEEGESKRERSYCSGEFWRIPATTVTISFDWGINLDPLFKLYTSVALDFTFCWVLEIWYFGYYLATVTSGFPAKFVAFRLVLYFSVPIIAC